MHDFVRAHSQLSQQSNPLQHCEDASEGVMSIGMQCCLPGDCFLGDLQQSCTTDGMLLVYLH